MPAIDVVDACNEDGENHYGLLDLTNFVEAEMRGLEMEDDAEEEADILGGIIFACASSLAHCRQDETDAINHYVEGILEKIAVHQAVFSLLKTNQRGLKDQADILRALVARQVQKILESQSLGRQPVGKRLFH